MAKILNKNIFIQKLFFLTYSNPLFSIGVGIVVIMAFIAIFAPFLATHDPLLPNTDAIFLPPSFEHFFGTDAIGRDVFSRILYGARVSLCVGFISVSISCAIGITIGLLAGYFRGIGDEIIKRFIDIMLCFPSFFLILAVVAFLGPNIINIMIIIGLTSWMGVARLIRAETLSLRERDFILAAKLAGTSTFKIIFYHILPNAISPVLVSATLGVAGAILIESSLSFLGIGVEIPNPSWGNILMEGKQALEVAWWLSFFPGMAILLTVLGYNLIGEYWRDSFDPKTRKNG